MKHCRFSLAALLFAGLLGGAASAQTLEQLLDHAASQTVEVKVVGVERKAGLMIQDVTFESFMGGPPTQAYVVRPETDSGPYAGVLFVHWFEPSSPTSNRTQYLQEAEALARRGTVSLLVSTFWSDPARYDKRKWETDFQNSVNQAKDLRRALDVLLSQPGVDPQRIGLVGHDYGAMFGSLVAAVDPRPKAYVLIAGTTRFPNWYLFGSSTGKPAGAALEKFREQFNLIDPVSVIGKAKASLFFQFGENDKYTPREDFLAFYTAASNPKRIATYPSDHPMEAEIIHYDREEWLAEQLELLPLK